MRVRIATSPVRHSLAPSAGCPPAHCAPRRMPRLLACACLALTLLLAGCSSLTFQSTFDKDGTARHQVTLAFEREDLLPQDISRIERGLDGVMERAAADGFEVQRISTSGEIGLRVMSDSIDATDAGAALNILFNTLLPTSTDAPVAPFMGTFTRESGAVGGNRFDLELRADGEVLFEALRAISPLSPQLQTPEAMSSVIRIRVIAILPGEVNESNGSVAGDRVTWTIPFTGTTELNAVSTIGQSTPWLGVVGLSVLATLLTAGVGYAAWNLLRKRNFVYRMVRTESGTAAAGGDAQVRTLPGLLQRLQQVGLRFITDPRPPRQPRASRTGRGGRAARRPAPADPAVVPPETEAEEAVQDAADAVVEAATETRTRPVDALGREENPPQKR